jgi:hypothetical protein
MDEVISSLIGCAAILVLWAALGLAMAWVLEWGWNILIPALFHGPRITYAMACAMYFLLSLVVGWLRPSGGKA